MQRESFELISEPSATTVKIAVPRGAQSTAIGLHYTVAMPEPTTHLFEITLQLTDWCQTVLDLKMPVWTPGSYLVREYARHVQDFSARDAQGQPIAWQKQAKNHWQLATPGHTEITVRYRVFANELTVRTNHLDRSHGYFNGAAIFCFIPGYQQQPITVTIAPPPNWQIATPLCPVEGRANTFVAPNFDLLVDSPFEIGQHAVHAFMAEGKPHEYVIWGENHNLDVAALIADTQKIIATEAAMFGGLPYDRYKFILHLPNKGYGGLEHCDSCCLIYSQRDFGDREKYESFIQLVAHEFFHLWNIKRIRPKALEVFDYEAENYTPSLWFSEGTTSYYDFLIPFRAGVYGAKTYLKNLSKEITRYLTTPGRWVQPLSESSFDAWIKLYRPDANTPNSQMSYYLKGAMVTLLLDLKIRHQHQNQKSFDHVLPLMWQQFGKAEIGFTPEQLKQVIESVAECDLTDFFDRYIHGLDALPFEQYLGAFGLKLVSNADQGNLPPFTGITLNPTMKESAIVKLIESGSPAEQAGMNADDEIIAIEGLRVTAAQFLSQLKDYVPGDQIRLAVFHQDVLHEVTLKLQAPRATEYFVVPMENPSIEQQQNFMGWLGTPMAAVS
jgi:predicted metalloprotease with PDZ domain